MMKHSIVASGLALVSSLAFAQLPPADATTSAPPPAGAATPSTEGKDTKPSSADDTARMTRTMGATVAPSPATRSIPEANSARPNQGMDPFQLLPFLRGGN